MERRDAIVFNQMKTLSAAWLFLLLVASLESHSQLMKTLADAHLIAENDSLLFRGKPLKVLLKEIGPEIKWVMLSEVSWSEGLAYFVFRFDDWNHNRQSCTNPYPVRIRAMIKESFNWPKTGKNWLLWTKEDAECFGNLTVAYIRVSGVAHESVQGL